MRQAWICALVATSMLLLAAVAGAQPPPDVVELHSGGFVRGTIVERTAAGAVVVQLATGKLRTIPKADVKYAGPDSRERASDDGQKFRVDFSASPPNLELWAERDRATMTGVIEGTLRFYEPICRGSCTTSLPRGRYRIGLARPRGDPTLAQGTLNLDGPAHVRASFESHAGSRFAGLLMLLLAVPTGATMFALSDDDTVQLAGGVIGAGALGGGIALLMQSDDLTFEVTPLATGSAPHGSTQAAWLDRGTPTPRGVGLAARF